MKDRCRYSILSKGWRAPFCPPFFVFAGIMRRLAFMKRVALAALAVCTAAGFAFGQAQNFRRYPAKVERAKAKAIDFRNSPGASAFRTRLRDGLRRGVNFAGHYVLVGWGCGTGCVSGAIIDARNGRVHFPKEFNAFGVAYTNDEYNEPLEYRKKSRL